MQPEMCRSPPRRGSPPARPTRACPNSSSAARSRHTGEHAAQPERSPARLLRCREVCARSRTTLWRQECWGQFPSSRKLTTNAVGWLESQIEGWIVTRVSAVSATPNEATVIRPLFRMSRSMRSVRASRRNCATSERSSDVGARHACAPYRSPPAPHSAVSIRSSSRATIAMLLLLCCATLKRFRLEVPFGLVHSTFGVQGAIR